MFWNLMATPLPGTPVHQLIYATIQFEANYQAAVQCLKSCRYRARTWGKVHIKHQNFGGVMISVTLAVAWMLVADGPLWVKQQSYRQKHLVDWSSQRRMSRLVINGQHKTFSESTKSQILRQQKSTLPTTAEGHIGSRQESEATLCY